MCRIGVRHGNRLCSLRSAPIGIFPLSRLILAPFFNTTKIYFSFQIPCTLKSINCKAQGNTVSGQFLERNDRLPAIGIGELKYSSCTFIFRDNLIQSFTSEVPAEFIQHNNEVWQKFLPWCKENHPDEHLKMFNPKGRSNYNRENGASLVRLLREWQKKARIVTKSSTTKNFVRQLLQHL